MFLLLFTHAPKPLLFSSYSAPRLRCSCNSNSNCLCAFTLALFRLSSCLLYSSGRHFAKSSSLMSLSWNNRVQSYSLWGCCHMLFARQMACTTPLFDLLFLRSRFHGRSFFPTPSTLSFVRKRSIFTMKLDGYFLQALWETGGGFSSVYHHSIVDLTEDSSSVNLRVPMKFARWLNCIIV